MPDTSSPALLGRTGGSGARREPALVRTLRVRIALHRRLVAALCTAIALWGSLQVLRPAPTPGVEVVVAATDLSAGRVVRAADLRRVRFPADVAPTGLDHDPVGRTVAGAMRAGEPFTDARVLAPALNRTLGDRAGVPVRIADAAVVDLLRVGDEVDVVAVDPTGAGHRVVARRSIVAGLPEERRGAGSTPAGAPSGALVVLGVTRGEAEEVAAAAAREGVQLLFPESR